MSAESIKITRREATAIHAALCVLEQELICSEEDGHPFAWSNEATHNGKEECPTRAEIDALCAKVRKLMF